MAALVAAGRGVTLLIHEATFDDSLGADAVQKVLLSRNMVLDSGARLFQAVCFHRAGACTAIQRRRIRMPPTWRGHQSMACA